MRICIALLGAVVCRNDLSWVEQATPPVLSGNLPDSFKYEELRAAIGRLPIATGW